MSRGGGTIYGPETRRLALPVHSAPSRRIWGKDPTAQRDARGVLSLPTSISLSLRGSSLLRLREESPTQSQIVSVRRQRRCVASDIFAAAVFGAIDAAASTPRPDKGGLSLCAISKGF